MLVDSLERVIGDHIGVCKVPVKELQGMCYSQN